MALSRRTLTLALALTPGIGGKTVTRALTRNDLLGRSPDDFLRIGPEALREEYGMKVKVADGWHERKKAKVAEALQVEERLVPLGVSLVTAADAHYPRRIEQMDADPPGVLFLYGNTKLLEAKTACVLSSRGTTRAGLEAVEKLAEEHVLDGKAIVSGHDTPEYQRSAVVPLRYGAPRLLVLDRGLFRALGEELQDEPFRAARLWRYRFDPKTDLAVSSLNPEKDFHPNSNKVRDRLIAGLSMCLDFVEVRPGGNMESLAKAALRCGRAVRVSDQAEASEILQKLGARPFYPD
ncbi:MAG: DNA-processing protein DprA [Armatimonadetes bacterium]|nr:DNA-processing protein DprA [Armatimonadota bacterium]